MVTSLSLTKARADVGLAPGDDTKDKPGHIKVVFKPAKHHDAV
jgi:hypothetical protein